MTDTKQRRAFLLINIPTHTRHMIQVAELLLKSGRYEPILVFYPAMNYSSVEAEIARLPCKVLLLYDTHFKWIGLAPPLDVHDLLDEPHVPWAWNQGRLTSVFARYPWLPYSPWVKKIVITTISSIRCLARSCAWFLAFSVASVTIARKHSPLLAFSKSDVMSGGVMRRMTLGRFALIWNSEGWLFRFALPKKGLYDLVSRLHDKFEPKLVLLPEDNFYYYNYFFIKQCLLNKIPSVVVPYTIVNTKELAENRLLNRRSNARGAIKRMAAAAFPEWTMRHKGRRLILPIHHILMAEHLGVPPKNPWLINSGHTTAIAAEGSFMRDYYIAAGIAQEKLCVTGALSDDVLTDRLTRRAALRAELLDFHGIAPEKPLMLLALPPNQIPGGPDGRPGFEFDDYRGLVKFIAAEMAAQGAHFAFAVNLHPRVEAEAVSDIFASHGIPIVPRPIEELVPLCDLYVASVSATIRLALNCGIPVVNYDAYHYEYDDYTGQPGILTMQKASEFTAVLQRLTTDASFFQTVKTAQQAAAKNYALLDGRSGERMLALFDRLTGAKAARASHG